MAPQDGRFSPAVRRALASAKVFNVVEGAVPE
jgi:hypothetical protein